MQTLTIEVNSAKALKLLEDLEELDLIKVIKKSVTKDKGKKLSTRLAGSITGDEAKKMHQELKQMRDEWERVI